MSYSIGIKIKNSNPILLLPGLGGSKLIYKNQDIWSPGLSKYLFDNKNWQDILTIKYENNKFIYNKDVKTLEFGNINSLDYSKNFYLLNNFYKNILDKYDHIYPIPYDFRLIHIEDYLDEFYDKFKNYIENFSESSIIIAHSSGGLVLHYFLRKQSKEWLSKYIKKIIYVNVPFGGLIVSLSYYQHQINLVKYLFGKDLIQSIGSIIINLPNPKYIKPILIIDNIEINDYFEYFKLDKIKEIYELNQDMINSFSLPNNVETKVIYSSKYKTPSLVNIKKNKIKIINGLGDNVVPLQSLLVPLTWNQSNLEFIHLPNSQHSTVLFSEELFNIINKN